MATKPTIVFVHGAWGTASNFQPTADLLTKAGYGYASVQMPSSTTDGPYVQGIDEDLFVIRNVLVPMVESGKDIVLVMHSYGGIPGSSAVKGLTKEVRENDGKEGGVVHLVYIAACVIDEGLSLKSAFGGELAPWCQVMGEDTYMSVKDPNDVFYSDLPEATANEMALELRRQATKSFEGECLYAAWKHVPSTYLLTEKDNAIPVDSQRGMLHEDKDGRWVSTPLLKRSGHTPFVSQPGEVARLIRIAAGEKV